MYKSYIMSVIGTCALTAFIAVPSVVKGAGKIEIDEDKWISLGGGLRTSLIFTEDGAPSDTDYSKEFDVESFRLYLNAEIHEILAFEANTELDSDDDFSILDAIGKFEFDSMLNVWTGRMLPPNDRANLDGPYYLATWHFPAVANRTPAIFAGRDDGVTVWGKTDAEGPTFLYGLGAFEGRSDAVNADDNLFYVGRLEVNLWDPEPAPWYYKGSTYLGGQDILAIGLVAQYQQDGTGSVGIPDTATAPATPTTSGDFKNWSVDFLMEKDLGATVLTLEGAFYDYDLDDVVDDRGFVQQGEGILGQISLLSPNKKLQPHYRFQSFDSDTTGDVKRHDLGVNYYIDGQNAKVYVGWGLDDPDVGSDENSVTLAVQLQI
jgi:hypothetical protein